MLQPIVDQFPAYEERRAELDAKIAEVLCCSVFIYLNV